MHLIKNTHIWLGSYLWKTVNKMFHHPRVSQPTHIMFCCVDHYEPDWQQASSEVQKNRVLRWVNEYPTLATQHKDADGKHPQHTFFYPAESYVEEHMNLLAGLCQEGLAEVEVHLHHDQDTEVGLKEKLEKAKADFSRHGLLSKRALSGHLRFAFIHGNWALNNSRRDGRWCGVNDETRILNDAGCYADFTFPSAPSETQPRTINSIYYVKSSRKKQKSLDQGVYAKVGRYPDGDLMLIQGPLTLNWKNRKNGILPRIENGEISAVNPPTKHRVDLWISQNISIKNKPDWVFVKVHTHGAPEHNADILLAEPMHNMYNYLETNYNDEQRYILHYVSAREMYNIIKAAEAGETGNPDQYRNYMIVRNQT